MDNLDQTLPPLSEEEIDYLEEKDENITEQEEAMEDNLDEIERAQRTGPTKKQQMNLYKLFENIIKAPDSSKTSNLDIHEMGTIPFLSVRGSQNMAQVLSVFDFPSASTFFKQNGEITLSTSSSKKGWMSELFVSQKKHTTRELGAGLSQGTAGPGATGWKKFFGGGAS